MSLIPKEKLRGRIAEERQSLQGKPPAQGNIKNRLQKTAGKALLGFFALMVAFTLVSRAAEGMTVARIQADSAKSGVLTDRITVNGVIEALGDLPLSLPGGIKVANVHVKKGQHVKEGDLLFALDLEDLNEQLRALEEKLAILNLRMQAAQSGISRDHSQGILDAQRALELAKDDYERLLAKLDRTSERLGEDYTVLERELTDAQEAYQKALKKAKEALVKAAEEALKDAQEALETMEESAREAIDTAQKAYDNGLKGIETDKKAYDRAASLMLETAAEYDRARAWLNELQLTEPRDEQAIAEAEKWVSSAQTQAKAAEDALNVLNERTGVDSASLLSELQNAKDKWQKKLEKERAKVKEAETELAEAKEKADADLIDEPAVIAAQGKIDAAEQALKTADRGLEDNGLSAEEQLDAAKRAIENAEYALENARRQAQDSAKTDEKSRAQAEIERLGYLAEQRELQRSISDLTAVLSAGGHLLAPIDGTVLEVDEVLKRTQEEGDVIKLSRASGGFCFTGKLTEKEAQNLSLGTKAQLKYTFEGKLQYKDGVVASLSAPDEQGFVTLKCSLPEGAYPGGASCEMTVTQKSEKYWSCLPLSALRSDQKGDYVLAVREKKSVLGLQQTVVRVPIEVIDRDSELMAVSGALMFDELVVTSANKPITEGDRVRLETD